MKVEQQRIFKISIVTNNFEKFKRIFIIKSFFKQIIFVNQVKYYQLSSNPIYLNLTMFNSLSVSIIQRYEDSKSKNLLAGWL